MTWNYLDRIIIDSNLDSWYFSLPFPKQTQVIKFVESMTLNNNLIPPEQINKRALLNIAENIDNTITTTKNIIIYPSNNPIIYTVPLHPFNNPCVGLKLLKSNYAKYQSLWLFDIYYWNDLIVDFNNSTNGLIQSYWELIISDE